MSTRGQSDPTHTYIRAHTYTHTSAHLTNEKNEPSLGSILRFLDSKIHVLDTTRREGNRSQDYWHLWYNMLSK